VIDGIELGAIYELAEQLTEQGVRRTGTPAGQVGPLSEYLRTPDEHVHISPANDEVEP